MTRNQVAAKAADDLEAFHKEQKRLALITGECASHLEPGADERGVYGCDCTQCHTAREISEQSRRYVDGIVAGLRERFEQREDLQGDGL